MKYDIRIASPCAANWNLMSGDDRIRHCDECHLSVHNFSRMSEAEIDDLLDAREGRICARFYQRADGTMLTQNCPAGLRLAFHKASRFAASFLSAAFTLSPAFAAAPQQKQNVPITHIKPAPSRLLLTVLDASGAVIPNAKVTLTNEASGLVFSGDTDDQGELHLSGLPHAKYRIVIIARGFRTFTNDNVSLPLKVSPRYTLEIGALMGEVVIVDQRNPVQKFFSRVRHIL